MDAWAQSDRKKNGNKTQDHELYPTPPEATRALLSVEEFGSRVWEPASGLGHISKVFEAAGHDVASTDLFAEKHGYGRTLDFLQAQSTGYGGPTSIVTNPPFSLLRPFMRQALTLPGVDKVALHAPFECLRVKSNVELWREFGFPRVHLLMPTLVIDCGPERGMVKSVFSHVWLVWEQGEARRDSVDLRHLFWKDVQKQAAQDLIEDLV